MSSILLLISGSAAADEFVFTVLPRSPAAERPFQLQVATMASACVGLPDSLRVKKVADHLVRFELTVPDYCIRPPVETTRTFSVPPLPDGLFTFEFALCTNAPPPLDPCHGVSQQAIAVGSGVAPSEIPATRVWMLPGLASVVSLLGWAALRRA